VSAGERPADTPTVGLRGETVSMERDYPEISRRFFEAVGRWDIATVRELYAPDVKIWHNTDGRQITREEHLEVMRSTQGIATDWVYDLTRCETFEGGCVQEGTAHITLSNGEQVTVTMCAVIDIQDGQIVKFNEYYDSAALKKLIDLLTAGA
jgi:uncharacterized protein